MAKDYPEEAIYNKLVRDRIPEIIGAAGLKTETKLLSEEDLVNELKKKVVEEAIELSEAKDKEETIKEMSDVLEILKSMAEHLDITIDEVEVTREIRAEKRGRFEKGIYLVRTYKENK